MDSKSTPRNEEQLADRIVQHYWEEALEVVYDPDVSEARAGVNPLATKKAFRQFVEDVEQNHRCPDAVVLEVVASALERVLAVDVEGKKGRDSLRTALGLTPQAMRAEDRALKIAAWKSVDALMICPDFVNDGWQGKKLGNGQPRLPRTQSHASELVADSLIRLELIPYIDSSTVQKFYQKHSLDLT